MSDVGMTVKDLREALEGLPDDARVIMQEDSEGNGYRWVEGAAFDGVLVEDNGWHAEISNADWSADDACQTQEDWDAMLAAPRVLVIHPVN